MTPEEMAQLHAACFVTPPPWTTLEFTDLLASAIVFSVDADHGFALGRAVAGEAELLTLAVAPDRRRAGIGRRLLDRFEHQAIARGAVEVFLEVAADNLAARSLYSTQGFAQFGRRRNYYTAPGGATIDAIVMRRSLFSPVSRSPRD